MLDINLNSSTDQEIIDTVDRIISEKQKNHNYFMKIYRWVKNECSTLLHPSYKKFCIYFLIKQKLNWLESTKYHLYKDEMMFIFSLLTSNRINYNKNTHRILLYHINQKSDKEKLKLLKLLSKINSLWSFLLFIRIKESSLTITRFKEKLLNKYRCINTKTIKLLYNSLPQPYKKYVLIYLFYLYAKSPENIQHNQLTKIYKTTYLLLNKTISKQHPENYYLIWQIAIKYLPTHFLKKLLSKETIQDRRILSYLIYYNRGELLPDNIKKIWITNTFKTEWQEGYGEDRAVLKRRIKNKTVLKALLWLWANQEDDGKWIASKHNPFHGNFGLPFFEGYEDLWYDIAETSLAIIAFTSAGFNHKNNNIFGSTVHKAIKWIIKNQNKEGLIDIQQTPYEFISGQYREPFSRNKHGSIRAASLYNHNISLYALTELFLLTKDKKLLKPLKKAYKYAVTVKYPIINIPKALNLDDIGPAVFAIIPLILLNKTNIIVDDKAINYIRAYIRKMEKDDSGQIYAFSPVPRCLGNYDSVATLLTIKGLLAIDKEKSPSISKSLKFLHNHLPTWNPFYKVPKRIPQSMEESFFNDDDIVNEFYWLFGSIAFKFYDNNWFMKWYKKLMRLLYFHQRNFGIYFGSFDPEGPWSKVGGRLYMTTMAILILQSPFLFKYN